MFFFLSNSEQALLRFAASMLRGTLVWVTDLRRYRSMDFFLFWPGYSQKNAFLKKTKKKKTKKEFMLHCVFHEFIVIVAIPEMTPETSR